MTRPRAAVLVAALVVGVVIALVVVRDGDDGGDDGSTIVDTDREFTIGHRDAPYRIVYRLDDLSDDGVAPSTDVVWVRQPFESRLETSSGAPPGDELQSIQIAALDRLRLGTLDEPLVIARVPALAVSDVRVAPVLDDAVRGGLLELREQRLVAARRCQVVRSGTLLGAGPLVPITRAEHADSCIDGEGLLLEEVLYRDGKANLHRVAVEVDGTPRITRDLFDAGDIVLPADKGGGSARFVDPTTGSLGPFWILPGNEPPDGFTRLGRISVIPPQPGRFASGTDPAIVAGTADVFVRGADFVVLYQGGTVGRVDAFPATPGAPAIDGGALGEGELLLSAVGTELRFPQRRGRFVHVIGTLAADELRTLARSLTETEGTGLVYLPR